MKRIVMVIGGVETLEYFSYRMGETFEKEGYAVFYYDLKKEEQSARKLKKFIRTGETALVTFNFEGLEKEPGVYKEGLGYIWDAYQIPCYNIAADHPYYYHERFHDLPKRYRHISIDRCQAQYFKDFYPEYEHLGFLPLAGTRLPESGEERTMDVIMTGNYTPPSFCEPYIHRINEEYAAFYQGIIEDLIAHPYKTVEEAALVHCEREMGKVPYEELRIAFSKMIFIDLYVRNYWRGKAVRTLADAGIRVDVFGKGWESLECAHPENLKRHPQTTSIACLEHLQHAKVSLNVMPWFKDGAHDRVFNSVLNGAVCVSDKSRYLCGELSDGAGVCYYNLEKIEELPFIVKELLRNEAERKEIVRRGMEKVQEKHTWEARAKQILEWLVF